MSQASTPAWEQAREVAESLREGVGAIFAGVLVVTLLALVLSALGAGYEARLTLAFPTQPDIGAHLGSPARALLSPAVLQRLEARGEDPGGLGERMLVLQRSDNGAELLAKGTSRHSASNLAVKWAQAFVAVRSAEIGRAADRLRLSAADRLRRARTGAARARELRRIALADVVGGRPSDGEVVRGPVSTGYQNLVPWPAPLAGLVLGAVVAIRRGARRRRRLRTAGAARALGPPLLAQLPSDAVAASSREVTFLGSKLALLGGLGPRSIVVSALDGSHDAARDLAAALGRDPAVSARTQAWDGRQPRADDVWLALLTLGVADPEATAAQLAELARTGRAPDGLVVVEPGAADRTPVSAEAV